MYAVVRGTRILKLCSTSSAATDAINEMCYGPSNIDILGRPIVPFQRFSVIPVQVDGNTTYNEKNGHKRRVFSD